MGLSLCVSVWFVRNYDQGFEINSDDTEYSAPAESLVVPILHQNGIETIRAKSGYRFLWLRSFHPTILIEVTEVSGNRVKTKTMEKVEIFGFPFWKLIKSEVRGDVTFDEAALYLMGEDRIFTLPIVRNLEVLDGSTWIFEAKLEEEHLFALIDSPPKGVPARNVGERFLELASTLHPVY